MSGMDEWQAAYNERLAAWKPECLSTELRAAKAENARLQSLLAQVHGMAREGCRVPTVADRWCERIDEICFGGAASPEYAEWAFTPTKER